jgi:hypothetical protein
MLLLQKKIAKNTLKLEIYIKLFSKIVISINIFNIFYIVLFKYFKSRDVLFKNKF